jgi:enoyl-CoA hydratase/carnithine racemase
LRQWAEQTKRNASKYFEVERKKRYAILKLNKPPVNSFSLEKFTQLNNQLNEFEQDQTLNGIILTSVFLVYLKIKKI